MVHAPNISLKVIVIAHLVLTIWASMLPGFLGTSYIYMNAFILAFGVWSIMSPESVESVLMFMILNLVSILLDIIFLGIFAPIGSSYYADGSVGVYRFCLGMAIVNLLIKPFTSFILYRLYQDRGGQYGDLGIPGIHNFGLGGNQGADRYEDIDQPVPSNNVESASPHSTIEKPYNQLE